jgi:membrane-associated phospholipid phosphatase
MSLWQPWMQPTITIGSPVVFAAAAAAAATVAAWRKRPDLAVLTASAMAATIAVPIALKPLIDRTKHGHLAFPSGHAVGSMCTAALAAGIIAAWPNLSTRTRRGSYTAIAAVATAGIIAPAAAGFHYPTDVVGSVLWATAVLSAAGWAGRNGLHGPHNARPGHQHDSRPEPRPAGE